MTEQGIQLLLKLFSSMKIEYESSKLSVPADFTAARLGKGAVVPKHDPRE